MQSLHCGCHPPCHLCKCRTNCSPSRVHTGRGPAPLCLYRVPAAHLWYSGEKLHARSGRTEAAFAPFCSVGPRDVLSAEGWLWSSKSPRPGGRRNQTSSGLTLLKILPHAGIVSMGWIKGQVRIAHLASGVFMSSRRLNGLQPPLATARAKGGYRLRALLVLGPCRATQPEERESRANGRIHHWLVDHQAVLLEVSLSL